MSVMRLETKQKQWIRENIDVEEFFELDTYNHLETIEENGELIGLAGIVNRYRILPSVFIIIKKGERGKGRGQHLMDTLLSNYTNRPIFLTVSRDNKRALAIYKKKGFRIVMFWRDKKYLMVKA